MPFEVDASIWVAFLGVCKFHRNIKLAEHAAKNLLITETQSAAVHVQLSNVYAAAGFWNDVEEGRNSMKHRGVKGARSHMDRVRRSDSLICGRRQIASIFRKDMESWTD
jgi:hypothetical protein